MTTSQRGAALLTAMLTVALVATLASAALWQQWRSLEIETAERARLQSQWILNGALDWARLILREDARAGGADHLAEPWAVPLEEARLSTFLASSNSPVDALDTSTTLSQTFLSGDITDLQSRMNVRNLVGNDGKPSDPARAAFARLFNKLQLPAAELALLVENLRFALDTSAENLNGGLAPLMPQRVSQLAWLGISAKSVTILSPYITVLPVPTPVNLNTASATVLAAVIPRMDPALAQRLVALRDSKHFRTLADAAGALGEPQDRLNDAQHSTSSQFFEIHGQLRLDKIVVQQQSVVQRTDGLNVKTLWTDRGPRWTTSSPLQ
jgi:general secretion pathway protein K